MKRIILHKTFIFIILIMLLLLFHFTIANDKKSQAEKIYQQAVTLYEQGECNLAIEKLKQALKLNTKMAKAHNKLALIYMQEETVYGRFWATIEIEKALKLEPNNLDFRFNQAVLNMKKGFSFIAEKQFKNILESDPYNYEAYNYLASLKEDEMLHYQDMISVDSSSDGIIYMQSFAEDLQQQAAEYYKKSISIKPTLNDSYYRLALIYYEFDNYDEMVQLLESAVKINPDDKNCHLFLGFAYQNIGRKNLALQQYKLAKQLMNGHESMIMETIDLILSPVQRENYQQMPTLEQKQYKLNFWKQKDPFYLTNTNERQLEHFSRIAYANLRFSRPKKDIEGWETDRGKVFIRFGKPLYRYRTKPYLGEMSGTGRNPLVHSREFWIYPDFTFKFEDEYLSDNYTFARDLKPEDDYKLIYEDKIKTEPDYYKSFPDSLLFTVPVDIVVFMGKNNKTELEFCFAIPLDQIAFSSWEDNNYGLKRGLFLFDQEWEQVVQKKDELLFSRQEQVELNGHNYFSSHEKAVVKPGIYHFALEFQDIGSGKRSAVHQDVDVDTFLAGKFQISDILFANDLEPLYSKYPFSRSDFRIIPNPLKIYKIGSPVVIYYEIYNLTKNLNGETHYKVEYRLGADYQSSSGWRKLFTKIGVIKKKGEVTTSYEYSGQSSRELQYQNIVLNTKEPARIKLTLKLTDLLTGTKIQQEEVFSVIE